MKRSKTNSGEGEGGKALAAGPVFQTAVLLRAHLWTGDVGTGDGDGAAALESQEEAEGAGVPPPALAMVADLLQVRGGELRESGAGLIAASFPDAVQAVNAARNVQRLMQGFSRAWGGGALGGCTTLTRVDEARDGVDVGSLRGNEALREVHPGQVVLLGSLCEAARGIPGLEFRAIAGVAVGPAGKSSAGGQALQLLSPVRMAGYVEEPLERRPVVEKSRGQGAVSTAAASLLQPGGQTVTPRAPAYVLASSPASGRTAVAAAAGIASGSGTAPGTGSSATISAAIRAMQPAGAAGDEVGVFAREEKGSGSGLSRWVMIGGVAAAVVAGVVVYALRRAPHPAPAAAVQQQVEAAPAVAVPAAMDNAVPGSEATPPPATPASVKTKAGDAARGKGAAHDAAPAAPDAEPTAPEGVRGPRGLTFTAAEISSIIAHADRDSGNGNFDKAIQEYRLVLSREPGNELAKKGLARAQYNKEHK